MKLVSNEKYIFCIMNRGNISDIKEPSWVVELGKPGIDTDYFSCAGEFRMRVMGGGGERLPVPPVSILRPWILACGGGRGGELRVTRKSLILNKQELKYSHALGFF